MRYTIIKYVRWLIQFGADGLSQLLRPRTNSGDLIRLASRKYGALWCRDLREDFDAINTVMVFGAYEVREEFTSAMTVIDLGANIGVATRHFREELPHARVVAVEPSASNRAVFEVNMQGDIKTGLVRLMPFAVGIENGTGHIRLGEGVRFDSFQVVAGGVTNGSPQFESVDIINIGEIVQGLERPLIVKIDIEGAEHELLLNRSQWLQAADYLMIEFHNQERERFWTDTLKHEGWHLRKVFDTWHFVRPDVFGQSSREPVR